MAKFDQDRPTKSWHRWLRFSLRTIFILTTIYCVWLAVVTLQARKQQRAVKRIEELGGRLGFDFQLDDQDRWKEQARFVPARIRKSIGEDYFRRIVIINFDEGSDPSDADLEILKDVPDLHQLTLSNRQKFTDAGLANLAYLSDLRVLTLDGTRVTGPGLRYIGTLRNLEGLTFSRAPLTDIGLQYVADLSNLKWLHLSNTNITDKGLRHLASLKSLEDIEIRDTNVSDAGLKHLEECTGLKSVLLKGTRTTPVGRAALQEALPNCRVSD